MITKKQSVLYSKEDLQNISFDAWKLIIDNRCRETMLLGLSRLIDDTNNSVKDRVGLSLIDEERARRIYDDLQLNPKHGTNLKKAVLLLFKYRNQLANYNIVYPDCLFEGD